MTKFKDIGGIIADIFFLYVGFKIIYAFKGMSEYIPNYLVYIGLIALFVGTIYDILRRLGIKKLKI